jgi:dienelactone hydrolase
MRKLMLGALLVGALVTPPVAVAQEPGSPEYVQRDAQNMYDAYGRQHGANGQLSNPAYLPALALEATEMNLSQLAQQAASPTRPALTPGNLFPGWNVGNPLRDGWEQARGRMVKVAWTNRDGALIRGDVFAPRRGARGPYTKKKLKGPFPAVVITTGSVQGSERMYWWLAQDLAERGYVVLTYDVQGQGTSETFPHQGPNPDVPFCDPSACPGVPAQQEANFVEGTEDALDFMLSTPRRKYPNPARGSAQVHDFNPLWKLIDRRDVGIVGHSLGASAVTTVQGTDERVDAVVALDKLGTTKPRVPALAVQSEYGFHVPPYYANHGNSIAPRPAPPNQGLDPARERAGFDAWRKAGVDTMLVVPRASTHLDYTDIPLVLPASRYGQALTSVYTQAWLDKYLKQRASADKRLLATSWTYLEPAGQGRWEKVTLRRDSLLSFYFCSGYDFDGNVNADVARAGC